MFGLSFIEIIIISVVALLVLGPERIPVVARSLGRALAELRRSVDEVKTEFNLHSFNRNDPFNLTQPRLPSQTGLKAEPLKQDEVDEEPIEIDVPLNCEERERLAKAAGQSVADKGSREETLSEELVVEAEVVSVSSDKSLKRQDKA